MAKYIQKNKDGKWAISNSKTGKSLRNTTTQKEAIALAGAYKGTDEIFIKRSSGWTTATGWDKKIANVTHSSVKKTTSTKKPDVKKPIQKIIKEKEEKEEKNIKPISKSKEPVLKSNTAQDIASKSTLKKDESLKISATKNIQKNATKDDIIVSGETDNIVKKDFKKESKELLEKETSSEKNMSSIEKSSGLPGWLGFLIGIAIISVVVAIAFLIGHLT